MTSTIHPKTSLSGWAVLLGLCMTLWSASTQANTMDPTIAEKIYKAIEKAQTDDPTSYLSTFDYPNPPASPLTVIDDPGDSTSSKAHFGGQ